MRGRFPLILAATANAAAGCFCFLRLVGWHTFRRTFASLLKANGEDVKVVQELCRHASPQTTLQLYVQAFSEDARRAQGKVVEIARKASKPETLTASAHNKPLNVPYCASTEGEISA